MKEMKMLIDKRGISKKLLELGLPQVKSNNSIDAISIVESFLVSIWIGCFRFSHTAVVRLDEVLRQIFVWKRVASGTTFGSFFKKFTPTLQLAPGEKAGCLKCLYPLNEGSGTTAFSLLLKIQRCH